MYFNELVEEFSDIFFFIPALTKLFKEFTRLYAEAVSQLQSIEWIAAKKDETIVSFNFFLQGPVLSDIRLEIYTPIIQHIFFNRFVKIEQAKLAYISTPDDKSSLHEVTI